MRRHLLMAITLTAVLALGPLAAAADPLSSWHEGEAKRQGWTVVDMKQDWKRIFS